MRFQGHYQSGDGLLHRLDARVKLVVALILIAGIVFTPEHARLAYPLLWTLLGVIAALSGLNAWRIARMGGMALPFTLAAATLLFTLPGQPLVSLAGLTITDAGLSRFLSIVIKSWLAVQVTLILSMTTAFADLLWAFRCLRVPSALVEIISFMYRYLFTLQDEAQHLIRARAARSGTITGKKSGGSLVWRAHVTGSMIGSLLLRSYERSERVYAAMLARGYSGTIRAIKPTPLPVQDMVQGVIPILLLVMIEIVSM